MCWAPLPLTFHLPSTTSTWLLSIAFTTSPLVFMNFLNATTTINLLLPNLTVYPTRKVDFKHARMPFPARLGCAAIVEEKPSSGICFFSQVRYPWILPNHHLQIGSSSVGLTACEIWNAKFGRFPKTDRNACLRPGF